MPERFAISAGTVVPMNALPIDDGAVIVSDGRIECVMERSQLPSEIPVEYYPAGILMPAFVNAHTHLALTACRGFADNVDFFTWLTEHLMRIEFDEQGFRKSAHQGVKESFRNGITTSCESFYAPWGWEAMLDAGMKGVFFYEVFGLGTLDLTRSVERHRGIIEELVKKSTDGNRAGISPHAPYTVTPPMAAVAMELAEKYKLPVSTHVAETRDEVELFLRGEGRFANIRRAARLPGLGKKRTPLEYCDELGILTDRTLLVHGIHLSDSDLDTIADRGCTMVTCPTSNAKLGAGIARAGAWVNRGIPVCIGTDSPASGETFDLFEEMRRFVLMQRGLTGETAAFPARSVIEMVTVNPAKAVGMEELVGDFSEGSCADMILVEQEGGKRSKYRDVYETLLWDITSKNIVSVRADGREVYHR